MTVTLTQYFEIHRRYHRSVNLERDLHRADAVEGYVLTERSAATLARILPAFSETKTNRHGHYGCMHRKICVCSLLNEFMFWSKKQGSSSTLDIAVIFA
ncbi:hypothetical protein [Picosynechococcus sp. PCC 11901]|uniref:hypothetical protein n=1 Tax=Picosynechococcus sp. PCC 11901 TaxID=2579791 RepID=UPI0015E8DC50|nr:hypothetical protein [Picosynechococcus sp. PCC 11901]